MSTSTRQLLGDAVAAPRARGQDIRHLFGPVIDFLCMGGGAVLLFPVMLLLPAEKLELDVSVAMLLAANVLNHPHFAYSYQIFYSGFRAKAFGPDNPPLLRARYLWAGIGVPICLAAFLGAGVASDTPHLLRLAVNLMVLLVGWHYVKQGYGILMIDAAYKKRYFDDGEKRLLRVNGYLVWLMTWMLATSFIRQKGVWGIYHYTFEIPQPILALTAVAMLATTVMTLRMLFLKTRATEGTMPWSGIAAYIASLYLWMLLLHINVLWLLVVPAMHSLQYLVVVGRYQLNKDRGRDDALDRPSQFGLGRLIRHRYLVHYVAFLLTGVVLGYAGFWGVPMFLDNTVAYNKGALGASAFLVVFWLFINIHHYFLDNVMWRSQNPDVRTHLFGPKPGAAS